MQRGLPWYHGEPSVADSMQDAALVSVSRGRAILNHLSVSQNQVKGPIYLTLSRNEEAMQLEAHQWVWHLA